MDKFGPLKTISLRITRSLGLVERRMLLASSEDNLNYKAITHFIESNIIHIEDRTNCWIKKSLVLFPAQVYLHTVEILCRYSVTRQSRSYNF